MRKTIPLVLFGIVGLLGACQAPAPVGAPRMEAPARGGVRVELLPQLERPRSLQGLLTGHQASELVRVEFAVLVRNCYPPESELECGFDSFYREPETLSAPLRLLTLQSGPYVVNRTAAELAQPLVLEGLDPARTYRVQATAYDAEDQPISDGTRSRVEFTVDAQGSPVRINFPIRIQETLAAVGVEANNQIVRTMTDQEFDQPAVAVRTQGGGGQALVTYRNLTSGHLEGQIASYDDLIYSSTPTFTSPVDLSGETLTAPTGEPAVQVAYDPSGDQYLVVWVNASGALKGQQVDTAGTPVGTPLTLAVSGARAPAVVYSPARGAFVVAWSTGAGLAMNTVATNGTLGTQVSINVPASLGITTVEGGALAAHPTTQDVLCFWSGEVAAGNEKVFMNLITSGGPASTSIPVSSTATSHGYLAAAFASNANEYTLAWREGTAVGGRWVSASGVVRPEQLSLAAGGASPSLAYNANTGEMAMGFIGSSYKVQVQRLAPSTLAQKAGTLYGYSGAQKHQIGGAWTLQAPTIQAGRAACAYDPVKNLVLVIWDEMTEGLPPETRGIFLKRMGTQLGGTS